MSKTGTARADRPGARPSGPPPLPAPREIRAERDRFVAFAFCAADVLLELDREGIVTYAGGATVAMTGRTPEAVVDRSVFDLVPEADREAMRRVLDGAAEGVRVEREGLRLLGPDGPTLPVIVSGYYLPDLGGRYFLSLRMSVRPTGAPDGAWPRDAESGLLSADSFAALGEKRVHAMRAGAEDVLMTVLDVENMQEVRDRLDAETRRQLAATLGQYLRSQSVDGESAGRLGGDRFGLYHAPDLDIRKLEGKLADITRDLDPAHEGLSIKAATVEIDSENLSEADAAKALVYTIKRFESAAAEGMTLDSLSDDLAGEMEKAARRITDVRRVIGNGSFDVAFQPIVELNSRRVHHFEALARFPVLEETMATHDFIHFAEEVGMVREFDLAMCRRVISWLKRAREAGKDYTVAVNLSGRSLSSRDFVVELLSMLSAAPEVNSGLMFEITESASISDLKETNRVLQALRKLGHGVCLDDFGAGQSAFQYLRALDVDMVKIDGSYVREALAVAKDRHFLKSMAGLCADLGIATVAEMIEEEKSIDLLRRCNIRYGQGYFFGRPSLDITSFDARRSAGPPARAAGGAPA